MMKNAPFHSLDELKNFVLIHYSRFGSELANVTFEFREDLKYHTAATDGEKIYFDPTYFASLSVKRALFVVAHELMHIKFKHHRRIYDKDGNKRNMDFFNEAADAVVNANLEHDGFEIEEGAVNRPEAFYYNVEDFYDILVKEKKGEEEGGRENSKKSNNQDQQQGTSSENSESFSGDDHSLWEEAYEKEMEQLSDNQKNSSIDSLDNPMDEKEEFEKNRQEQLKKAKQALEEQKNKLNGFHKGVQLGNVGDSSNEIDWRLLLRREIEKDDVIWSQRRSVAENNYAYRIEDICEDDAAETEILIDISGSVCLELVRAFLRMIKPIIGQSKLRVGCFNEKYWGMVEIHSVQDINQFIIPEGARGHYSWTEDWDLAVRSFTKKSEINKIIFTDGYPGPGVMPKDDLRGENILWLVYGNKAFRPCCGKVIFITPKQLEKLQNFENYTEFGKTR